MAMSEAQRLQLFDHYKTQLGEPLAEALMTTIPPFDWHELATKTDLARLEARFDERLDDRLTALSAELRCSVSEAIISQTRWTLGYVTTLCGLALAIAKWFV